MIEDAQQQVPGAEAALCVWRAHRGDSIDSMLHVLQTHQSPYVDRLKPTYVAILLGAPE